MTLFENELRDHIDKEDNGLFPAAAIALGGPEWIEVHEITPHSHDGDTPHVHPAPSGHTHQDEPVAAGHPGGSAL